MAERVRSGIENVMDGHLKGLILPEIQDKAEPPIWLFLITALVLLLIVFGAWRWYRYRQSPAQMARRNLARLHAFLPKSQQRQDIAIQLSSFLCNGLQVTRLELYQPKQVKQQKKWQQFLKALEAASYSQKPPTLSKMERLFKQSDQWLR